MMDRLHPDAIIYAIAGSGWSLERKKYQVIPESGELLKLGLVCTTYYFKKYYTYLSKTHMPDLFFRDENRSVLVTVEITTNPEKENLISQLKHFLSEEYQKNIVDEKYHEVWLIVKAGISDKIIKRIENEKIITTTHLVIFTIDYDSRKGKYALKRIYGDHIRELIDLNDLIPIDQPLNFPWLSAKLSLPSVLHNLGLYYFSQMRYRYPPIPLKTVYENCADIPLPYNTFKKYMSKLVILMPELIKIDKNEMFSIKIGSPKVILDKLDNIIKLNKEEIDILIADEEKKQKQPKSKSMKSLRKRKITSYKIKTQTKLDKF